MTGSLFQHLAHLFCYNADVLHNFDNTDFHIMEDFGELWFLGHYLLADVLHEILFFVPVFFEHHIVEDKSQQHWNCLDVLLCFRGNRKLL